MTGKVRASSTKATASEQPASEPTAPDKQAAANEAAPADEAAPTNEAANEAAATSEADEAGTEALGALPLTLINPGNTSIVYDLDGHSLAPGTSVQVTTTDRVTWQAVRTRNLLCRDAEGTWLTFDKYGNMSPRPLTSEQQAAMAGQTASAGEDQAGQDTT